MGDKAMARQRPRTCSRVATNGTSPECVDELFARLRESQDPAVRDALVEHYLPLARAIALRFLRPRESIDDLYQVASLGLVKAVDRFDPARGLAFSTYAVPTISGEIKRYRRDVGWALRVPRSLQEDTLRVEAAAERLTQSGRTPTPARIAAHLEMSTEGVLAAIEAGLALRPTSLDAPLAGDRTTETTGERFGGVDGHYELVELAATLSPALDGVPPRERAILYLRFVEDRTQSEIARLVGISQMQVSRLIRRTLEGMREVIA